MLYATLSLADKGMESKKLLASFVTTSLNHSNNSITEALQIIHFCASVLLYPQS